MPGCSDDPGSLTTGRSPYDHDTTGDGDGGAADPPPSSGNASPAPAQTQTQTFGDRALARAQQWIDAKMPYCGGPNGGHDLICGGTCERTGEAKNPAWDPYRSDCSGFVSWAWGLPPPGHTTGTLAPFDTSVSLVIDVDALEPGDALNNDEHVMLFGGWVDKAAGKAHILEESTCNTVAKEAVFTFKKVGPTTLQISDGREFRTIRYKNRDST